MNIPIRITVFGALSGLLWSSAPYLFTDGSSVAVMDCLVAGIITGLLVSFALYKPLLKFNRWGVLFLGILSLPISTLCFGVCAALFDLVTGHYSSGTLDVPLPLIPFYQGIAYAYLAMAVIFTSFYGFIFPPLAVLTTYLLRQTIFYRTTPKEIV
jgi:hypothetical protein